MIGIITCSRKTGDAKQMFKSFDRTLMCGYSTKLFEMVGFDTIAAGYNEGMRKASNDKHIKYLIFTHSDVLNFASLNAIDRVLDYIDSDDVGFVGVAGAKYLNASGIWWNNPPDKLAGGIVHESGGKLYQSRFGNGMYEEEVLALDGVFLMASADALYANPPIIWKSTGYHFYDIDACLQMHKRGYKNYTVNIPLVHKSIGETGPDFELARLDFVKRWVLPQGLPS